MNAVAPSASQAWQEWVALALVAAVTLHLLDAPFRGVVLKALSEALLRRGRVKWAMRVRRWSDPRWARAGTSSKKTKDTHCG